MIITRYLSPPNTSIYISLNQKCSLSHSLESHNPCIISPAGMICCAGSVCSGSSSAVIVHNSISRSSMDQMLLLAFRRPGLLNPLNWSDQLRAVSISCSWTHVMENDQCWIKMEYCRKALLNESRFKATPNSSCPHMLRGCLPQYQQCSLKHTLVQQVQIKKCMILLSKIHQMTFPPLNSSSSHWYF